MFYCLPDSAWAGGSLAEVTWQVDKMVEHPNQSQTNPGPRADGTPCTCFFESDIQIKNLPRIREMRFLLCQRHRLCGHLVVLRQARGLAPQVALPLTDFKLSAH